MPISARFVASLLGALLLLPPTARAAGEGSVAVSLDCDPVRGTLVVRNDSAEERTLEYIGPEYNLAVEANPFLRGDRFEPGQSLTYYLGPAPRGAEGYELGPKLPRKDAVYTGFYLRFHHGVERFSPMFIDCSRRKRTFDFLREIPPPDKDHITIEAYCADAFDRIAVVNAVLPNAYYKALGEGKLATAAAAPSRDDRLRIRSVLVRASPNALPAEFRRDDTLIRGETAVYYLGSVPRNEMAAYPHQTTLDASTRLDRQGGAVRIRAVASGRTADLEVTCQEGVALFGEDGRLDGLRRVVPGMEGGVTTRDAAWFAGAASVIVLAAGIAFAARRAAA